MDRTRRKGKRFLGEPITDPVDPLRDGWFVGERLWGGFERSDSSGRLGSQPTLRAPGSPPAFGDQAGSRHGLVASNSCDKCRAPAGRVLSQDTFRKSVLLPLRPGGQVIVSQVLPDQLEICCVFSDQDRARFPAGCSKEKVVHQRFPHTPKVPTLLVRHGRNRQSSLLPRRMTRGYHTSCPHQGSHQILPDLSSLFAGSGSDQQLVQNDGTEIGGWREICEKPLQLRRVLLTAKCPHV